ncbi:hypothetical protein ACWJKU_07620 [Methylocaldum sp. MU1018]
MNTDNPLAARARLSVTDAPLSDDSQSRLWFLWTLEPDSAPYNLGFLLRIRGGLDMAAARGSPERIVGCHEILRTRYPKTTI